MHYVITEQAPRGTAAPIAEAATREFGEAVFDLALSTATAPGWTYALLERVGDGTTTETTVLLKETS